MLEYKGYVGSVVFDSDAEIFYGEVVGLRDVITFQGMTTQEIKQAFQESIDDYLDFCKERGEKPEKPYSGRFVLRTSAELHKKIAAQAATEGKSINAFINETLEKVI
ncbi:type II toxin-antitoxin system HicB family antitoxin [Geovibrio ferrireducens]|uniref:type II toxin-antitoxin system HicB family antitoxin n=1 Tax=Geovibrio ferrireducens TaxID=46201 RepID=UPI002245A2D4|nr:type II toxin-antitoxin system HicB family antitoxin [Geovibrio ferrireducens]